MVRTMIHCSRRRGSALGRYNGAVVAVDPNTGRILTVVNQKIAFGEGYIPCSTIKPTIAIAALKKTSSPATPCSRLGAAST